MGRILLSIVRMRRKATPITLDAADERSALLALAHAIARRRALSRARLARSWFVYWPAIPSAPMWQLVGESACAPEARAA